MISLTPAQEKAVLACGKNVLVSAGAGSGKTRVLVERYLHELRQNKLKVSEILALTFTEKAALEMKSRIIQRLRETNEDELRRDLESGSISTMHSLAAKILREHPIEAEVDPEFKILDEQESFFLIEEALDEALQKASEQEILFRFLKTYGENSVRTGVLRIFETARNSGRTIRRFVEDCDQSFLLNKLQTTKERVFLRGKRLLETLDDQDLILDWKQWHQETDWTWEKLDEFYAWFKPFSRKGGKEVKEVWKELAEISKDFFALQLEVMTAPGRKDFAEFAYLFESIFEQKKREDQVIDFQDLEIKFKELLMSPKPACVYLRRKLQGQFKTVLVDEFQDTSPLQLQILEMLSKGDNLFLVGDYKQSIYAFRGAFPEQFLFLEEKFSKEGLGYALNLRENFRASESLIAWINRFFDLLWEEDNFHFAQLVKGQVNERPSLPEDCPQTQPVEVWAIQQKEEESIQQARMREAALIAKQIAQMHEGGTPYGDIVVLFQASSSIAIYENALKRSGIPYFLTAGRGFYHQPEIRDLVSFLSSLDNPLSDVSLAALMRSPLFHINDDALFWFSLTLKQNEKQKSLFEGLHLVETIREIPEESKEKLKFFRTLLFDFMKDKDAFRISELLSMIVEKTNYDFSLLSDEQGIRRYANVRKLIDLAREMEEIEPLSISAFVRLVKGFQNQEIHEAEAPLEEEQGTSAVRMMTIHAAKGLEFPIVFVADLAHVHRSRGSNDFIADVRSGYGLRVPRPDGSDWEEPLAWRDLNEEQKKREKAEKKRLLYVALTRAQQKLILTGVFSPPKKAKESFQEMSTWMDWVILASRKLGFLIHFSQEEFVLPAPGLKWKREIKAMTENRDIASLEKEVDALIHQAETPEKLAPRSLDLPVSALALYKKSPAEFWRRYEGGRKDLMETEEEFFTEELDIPEDSMAANDFGTRMHAILENIHFQNPQADKRRLLDFYFAEALESEKAEAASILENFLNSEIFQQIKRAKKIARELPFVLNARYGRVDGVVDLVFQDEKGDWHIVDYKTASGDEEKAKEAGYELQIFIYALAFYKITGEVPKTGKVLYLKNQAIVNWDMDLEKLEAAANDLQVLQNDLREYYAS